MSYNSNPVSAFPLRLFQHTGAARHARGSLSGSYAELVDMESLLSWDERLMDSIKSMKGSYPSIFGGKEIRKLVANMLGLDSNDIIITNGVDDAIPSIYAALFQRNDSISFLQTAYDPLIQNAKNQGLKIHKAPLLETENGWQISQQIIEDMTSQKMSACLLNIPHNPTGWFPSAKEIQQIISQAEKNQCLIIADEVYAGLNLSSNEYSDVPYSLATLSEQVVSVGSLTKSFGLPGLRIGWIACKNHTVIEAIKNQRTYGHCYTSSLSEIVACSALRNGKKILQRNEQIAKVNLDALSSLIERWNSFLSFNRPSHGTVCFVRFNPSNTRFNSAKKLSSDLLEKEKLILLDNSFFNFSENWFRFGFATNSFGGLLEIFDQYLQKNLLNLVDVECGY
ncbi:MAG: pyridoxal phosphate-dependent aminotransferase [Desulfuromonadales bacterium]|nr:pyridoxal phosphate-dependent aminotransferase [Desulfuromonadales bacterium]